MYNGNSIFIVITDTVLRDIRIRMTVQIFVTLSDALHSQRDEKIISHLAEPSLHCNHIIMDTSNALFLRFRNKPQQRNIRVN